MDKRKTRRGVRILSGLYPFALVGFFFVIFALYWIGRPASYLWVMDTGELKNETYLVKMCPTGERLVNIQFGQGGEIDIDPATHIVWAPEVGDVDQIHYDQVVQIDQNGKILDRFQGYSSPILAVDRNDGSVWVSTWHEFEQRAFMTKIAPSGKFIRSVGGFYLPAAVALDPRDSSIWVADSGNHNITHLSRDGELLFQMPVSGYFFTYAPDQIAVDPESGNVWFTTATGKFYKLSAQGEVLFERTGLSRPVAVAFNPRTGNLWVADFEPGGSGDLLKLDSEGHVLLIQALPAPPHAAAINPFDGTLWVGVDGEMIRYDDRGQMEERQTGFRRPESIVFEKAEKNWLTQLKCTFYFYSEKLR